MQLGATDAVACANPLPIDDRPQGYEGHRAAKLKEVKRLDHFDRQQQKPVWLQQPSIDDPNQKDDGQADRDRQRVEAALVVVGTAFDGASKVVLADLKLGRLSALNAAFDKLTERVGWFCRWKKHIVTKLMQAMVAESYSGMVRGFGRNAKRALYK